MNKAIFKYKKDDGTISDRVLLKPTLLKESTNSLKDFQNPNVKYIHGYEIKRSGMTGIEIAQYEKLVEEYFTIAFPTLEAFLSQNGLDPKKLEQKSFKKDGIQDLKIV